MLVVSVFFHLKKSRSYGLSQSDMKASRELHHIVVIVSYHARLGIVLLITSTWQYSYSYSNSTSCIVEYIADPFHIIGSCMPTMKLSIVIVQPIPILPHVSYNRLSIVPVHNMLCY